MIKKEESTVQKTGGTDCQKKKRKEKILGGNV